MPRSFAVEAESPTRVEQFHSAFIDKDYWRARVAAGDSGPGTSTLDAFVVDAADTVSVTTTVVLLGDALPAFMTQLYRGDLRMVHSETWNLTGEGSVCGQLSATLSGVPLKALGAAVLTPLRNGSLLNFTATVGVKVPIVGGMIERFVGSRLTEGLLEIQAFTSAWITENRGP